MLQKIVIHPIALNSFFMGLYLLSLSIFTLTSITYPLQLFAFLILLIVTPYNFSLLFRLTSASCLENILVCIALYFSFVTPLFFLLNKVGYTLDIPNILILFLISATLPYIFQKKAAFSSFPLENIFNFLKKHWVLFLLLFLFACLHCTYFYFYKFIPEGDGFLDMARIENTVKTGEVSVQYRATFNTALALFQDFGKIPGYTLFSFWMLIPQISVIISLYLLALKHKIKDSLSLFLILFSALSVPVLSMEIDYVRPHSVVIILFPIYIYFFYLALTEKKRAAWILSTLIAVLGTTYHQFFFFILLTHGLWASYFLTKTVRKNYDNKSQVIILLSFLLGILTLYIILVSFSHVSVFQSSTYGYLVSIVPYLTFQNWRWWFLSSYPAEAQSTLPMGWSGIMGSLKFYAYYSSPLIIFYTLIIMGKLFTDKRLHKEVLLQISAPLIMLFLFFAEILPRLGRPIVPERFWLLIDILILFSSVVLFKSLQPRRFLQTVILWIIFLLMLIGIGGSLYIASGKKEAIISEKDLQATQWIQSQTSKDALFITQASNDALFSYYFKRSMVTNIPEAKWNNGDFKINMKADLESYRLASQFIPCKEIKKAEDAEECILSFNIHKKNQAYFEKEIELKENILSKDIYIYYSLSRFSNIFSQREWWCLKNYCHLDINALNQAYTLVYNKDGVFIWKIQ